MKKKDEAGTLGGNTRLFLKENAYSHVRKLPRCSRFYGSEKKIACLEKHL